MNLSTLLTSNISNREQKQNIAHEMAKKAKNGDVIGVGSGSTSLLALQVLAERVQKEKLYITAIPTSHEIELACAALQVPTTSLLSRRPDWCFDGADEVDPQNNLIKGRGGALFREKLVMKAAPKAYILADQSKFVDRLGSKFPVPVEVYPDAIHMAEQGLKDIGAEEVTLRLAQGKDGPVITESGNLLLDARFKNISPDLEQRIKSITGVLESGLFIDYPVEIISV